MDSKTNIGSKGVEIPQQKQDLSSDSAIHYMPAKRLNRLKKILSIPSHTGQEKQITKYIVNFCKRHKFQYVVDDLGSVLITKGQPKHNQYFPMVCAHTDSVHPIQKKIIRQQDDILTAWSEELHQIGCGGDDSAGVHICLELLLIMPILKVGLFVSEEIGCVGSRNAIANNCLWFADAGYVIEFDAPEDYMISHICSGVELFDVNGKFYKSILPLLEASMGPKMTLMNHPYTDVSVIKKAFDFSCINISASYYRYHTRHEYVVISEVEKAILLGEKMIKKLGNRRYNYKNK